MSRGLAPLEVIVESGSLELEALAVETLVLLIKGTAGRVVDWPCCSYEGSEVEEEGSPCRQSAVCEEPFPWTISDIDLV